QSLTLGLSATLLDTTDSVIVVSSDSDDDLGGHVAVERINTLTFPDPDDTTFTFSGQMHRVYPYLLPDDVREVAENISIQDLVVTTHRAVTGLEFLNQSKVPTVSVTVFDPWHRISTDTNPVRDEKVSSVHRSFFKLGTWTMAIALRSCTLVTRQPAQKEAEMQALTAWILDRAFVWGPMFTARMARAKYKRVAHSDELLKHRLHSHVGHFDTPKHLHRITHAARRTVEFITGRAFSVEDYRVEAAQSVMSRNKLGLLFEMEGDEVVDEVASDFE
ncbi:hypothetical protein OF83DRAFT_1085068, partial [Amylostereum chailletii]